MEIVNESLYDVYLNVLRDHLLIGGRPADIRQAWGTLGVNPNPGALRAELDRQMTQRLSAKQRRRADG